MADEGSGDSGQWQTVVDDVAINGKRWRTGRAVENSSG